MADCPALTLGNVMLNIAVTAIGILIGASLTVGVIVRHRLRLKDNRAM